MAVLEIFNNVKFTLIDGVANIESDSYSDIIELANTNHSRGSHGLERAKNVYYDDSPYRVHWCNGSSRDLADRMRHAPQFMMNAYREAMQFVESRLQFPTAKRRKRVRRLEDGDELDLDRFRRGDLDCWSGIKRIERQKKLYKICIDTNASCNLSFQTAIARGVTAVCIADIVERLGHTCEIVIMQRVNDISRAVRMLTARVVCKAAGSPIDTSTILTLAGDINFLRRAMFSTWCRACPDKPSGGLGRVRSIPYSDRSEFDYFLDNRIWNLEETIDVLQNLIDKEQPV